MRYGDKVLHWHIIMAFEYETEFTKEDILKIQSYWKHGNADIRHVKSLSVGYLMKYVGKALGLDSAMRRIGSSRIEAFYRQSLSALCKAVQFFGSVSELFDYYWYRGRAFLYEDNVYKRGRCYIYYPRKLWEVVFNSNSNGGLI
ncbi:MAG: hypothetical protein LLF28_02830 [Nitrospiraceae bacterium]|nr:hypothetical protein [Nitrospiraceae bacterium]